MEEQLNEELQETTKAAEDARESAVAEGAAREKAWADREARFRSETAALHKQLRVLSIESEVVKNHLAEQRQRAESAVRKAADLETQIEQLRRVEDQLVDELTSASRATEGLRARLETVTAAAAAAAQIAAPAAAGFSIAIKELVLVATDDGAFRQLASEALADAGYRVITASDGLEALRLVMKHRPRLVVTNLIMPKLDGRELCQLIKSNEQTTGIKVAVISDREMSDTERASARSHYRADDFLHKPVSAEMLTSKTAQLLQTVAS